MNIVHPSIYYLYFNFSQYYSILCRGVLHLLLNYGFDAHNWYFSSSFSNIFLLVYQHTNEFCILNLYLAVLLNLLILIIYLKILLDSLPT